MCLHMNLCNWKTWFWDAICTPYFEMWNKRKNQHCNTYTVGTCNYITFENDERNLSLMWPFCIRLAKQQMLECHNLAAVKPIFLSQIFLLSFWHTSNLSDIVDINHKYVHLIHCNEYQLLIHINKISKSISCKKR